MAKLSDNQILLMKNHLTNALNNIDKKLVFCAFQDVMQFLKVFFRYVRYLKDVRINNEK